MTATNDTRARVTALDLLTSGEVAVLRRLIPRLLETVADSGVSMPASAVAAPPRRAGTLSLADAARHLGVGQTTAYELVKRGEFPVPVKRIGGRLKVLRHDLDRYLRGEEVRP